MTTNTMGAADTAAETAANSVADGDFERSADGDLERAADAVADGDIERAADGDFERAADAVADSVFDGAAAPDNETYIDTYLRGLSAAIDGLSRADVRAAMDMLVAAGERGSRIYLVGNGGSAATASHMAVDLAKQASPHGKPPLRAFALTDNVPLMTAWSNDEAYETMFARQLANHVEADDVLVAISCSGMSPNVLRAAELARGRGAKVLAFTGDDGGGLAALADALVRVPTPDVGHQEIVHLAIDHTIAAVIQGVVEGQS